MARADASRVRRRTGTAARTPRRLPGPERRRHLVRVASRLMSARGVDAVQLAAVAAEAGVSRPVVYRFFANRRAIIIAVLEDFAADVTERFARGAMRAVQTANPEATRIFIEAMCDAIEEHGAGPWNLLDAKGPDPEIARVGQEIIDRLMAPWRKLLIEATGATASEVFTLARMIVASGRAAIELWCAGRLTREEVVRDTTRGVSALVESFVVRPMPVTASRPRAPRPRTSLAISPRLATHRSRTTRR